MGGRALGRHALLVLAFLVARSAARGASSAFPGTAEPARAADPARPMYPLSGSRHIADLTWPEVRDRAAAGTAVVVPVGSTEQHGYHLPLCTDVVLPEQLASRRGAVARPARGSADRLRLPLAAAFRRRGGVSRHAASAGGRSCPSRGRHAGLVRTGFSPPRRSSTGTTRTRTSSTRRPGSPTSASDTMRFDHGRRGRLLRALRAGDGGAFADEFPGWDVEHAAVLETSLMLHLRPDLVLFDRAVDDAAARHPFYDVIPTPATSSQ